MGSVIIGSGKSLPKRVVTNDDLSRIVDTNDEWIVRRTGIHSRHIAVEESGADLGAQACARALGLEEGGWLRDGEPVDPASIDMLICMTITPDCTFPSEAALIRRKLGLKNAISYDLSAACAGCVYGLSTADRLLTASALDQATAQEEGRRPAHNPLRRILIVAVERISTMLDWTDRATCVLFGDGAAAVLLEWREGEEGVISTYLENTDDVKNTLYCDSAFGDRVNPFAAEAAELAGEAVVPPCDPYVHMAGQSVFKFATGALIRCAREVLDASGMTLDDIKLFTPHQANDRIIRYAAKKMGLPMEKFQMTIDHTGNISGAGALIALNEALMEGNLTIGDYAIMVAFGGGLTAGGALFKI